MKLTWTTDKQKAVASQYGAVVWSQFKTGNKNKAYHHLIPNDSAENYEFVLKFDLHELI
jgi:hypothetical protein